MDETLDDNAFASTSAERDLGEGEEAKKLQSLADDAYAGFLTPLQHSLVYELTKRREGIQRKEHDVGFWEQHHRQRREGQSTVAANEQARFGADVLGDEWYDEQIRSKSNELKEKHEALSLQNAIVASADAAHAINASMAAVPPAPPPPSASQSPKELPLHMYSVPRTQQPLRSIVAHRDKLALQFLQIDKEIKEVKEQQQHVAQQVLAVRSETAATLARVKSIRADMDAKKMAAMSSTSLQGAAKARTPAHERIAELQSAVNVTRGKREMVKGVLRGLILESGLDWMGNDSLCKLVLALGDDGSGSSDEDDGFIFGDDDSGDTSGDDNDIRNETT